MKQSDEMEFLPAALEIQETPPLPMSRYILRAIMCFFVVAITWASLAEVDIVGIAHGKIIPSGKVKIIQPHETSIVRSILVEEGQHVKKGQLLIGLDSTITGADSDAIKEQQLANKLNRATLIFLLNELNNKQGTGTFSGLSEASVEQISIHKQRAHSRLNEYLAKIAILEKEKQQRQAERNAISQRIQQLDSTIPLITERSESLKNLTEKNMLPRVQWLEIEEKRIEQVKERDVQINNLASMNSAIANIDKRQESHKAAFKTEILTELADTENRITALKQEKVKAEKRVTLQNLLAPVSGKVHQLAIHTIGGVVTPAQELMHIVPDNEAIEIEAWLPNKDIGFVHEGQSAEIKVETFPFTRYVTIEAEILNVSNDATPDENLGLVYAMRVKMYKSTMQVKDKLVNLSPGMAVTVEMNMGKRRLIEFLLTPLLRYKDESVRER